MNSSIILGLIFSSFYLFQDSNGCWFLFGNPATSGTAGRKCVTKISIAYLSQFRRNSKTCALSFYRFQNVLCQSKFFVSYQKFIYVHIVPVTNILCQNKRWFAFSNIGFCAGTKVFEEALNAIKFLDWLKKFGPTQNTLGPVKGQGIDRLRKKVLLLFVDLTGTNIGGANGPPGNPGYTGPDLCVEI